MSDWRNELGRRFEDAEGIEAGLYAIAIAIESLAYQVKYLGNGDAATTMGALEGLGAHLGEKLELLASVVGER